MARTVLTDTTLTASGVAPTYVTPDVTGAQFRNTHRNVLHVKNASASSVDVTVKIGKQVLGLSVTSPAVAVAAGTDLFFGPFADDYEQPALNDQIYVDFSAVTSVTVALLSIPQ